MQCQQCCQLPAGAGCSLASNDDDSQGGETITWACTQLIGMEQHQESKLEASVVGTPLRLLSWDLTWRQGDVSLRQGHLSCSAIRSKKLLVTKGIATRS